MQNVSMRWKDDTRRPFGYPLTTSAMTAASLTAGLSGQRCPMARDGSGGVLRGDGLAHRVVAAVVRSRLPQRRRRLADDRQQFRTSGIRTPAAIVRLASTEAATAAASAAAAAAAASVVIAPSTAVADADEY